MSRDKIHGKSFNSRENVNCTPRYVNVFKNVTEFPNYDKKYRGNGAKGQDHLLKKLKSLKPNDKKFSIDDDCHCDSLNETSGSKEQIFFGKNERKQMIPVNGEKTHEKEDDSHNRGRKVCEQLNESSRLSKKMHRNSYDRNQGKHYSKGFFEKFPDASGVTSLDAVNSCSSLDAPVYRRKKQQTKPSCNKYRNNANNKIRGNGKKGNKLSCTSLVVNCSPESDYDCCQDKQKILALDEKREMRNSNICQCSSESGFSNEDNVPDKNFEDSRKSYNCCCADEEKVKAGYSYHCRCPGYREDTDYANFKPKYFATPKNNGKSRCFGNNSKLKKYRCQDNKSKKIKEPMRNDLDLSDFTPDVPLPSHWSQCGQHMSNVANEYRQLLRNFKTIQSMALNPSSRKSRKKFTRTYPSGKEFSFEVKPAKDVRKGENFSLCQCKNCSHLVKSLKNTRFAKNSKKSVILDGYNKLIKRLACEKSDERFSGKNFGKKKMSEISVCVCKRRKIRNESVKCKEKMMRKENSKTKNCHLKKPKLKSLSENSSLKNENLNPDDDKLNKCQELDGKNQELSKYNFPRIVKPRGASCRDNLRKIFVYPPHGEEGPPLTLNKKCSNIDCRIKGDIRKGYRYKVTYKQEFLSPIWYPEEKGGPFRKKENTTEYG